MTSTPGTSAIPEPIETVNPVYTYSFNLSRAIDEVGASYDAPTPEAAALNIQRSLAHAAIANAVITERLLA